jgi:hypothetical protein
LLAVTGSIQPDEHVTRQRAWPATSEHEAIIQS